MYETYRKGKYVILSTEGSVDQDYIDELIGLFDRFGLEHRWDEVYPYPSVDSLVVYCNDERKWKMIEAFIAEINEKYDYYAEGEIA